MRFHRFALILICTPGTPSIAQTDFTFDQPLGELDTDGINWNTDTFFENEIENTNPSIKDTFLSFNDGFSDSLLFADNPDLCTNGYQSLNKIRARSGESCVNQEENSDGLAPKTDQSNREATLTQEKINEDNCPAEYYQKIFRIPVCALHNLGPTQMSGPFDEDGFPLDENGLQDVRGTLMDPITESWYPCEPKRIWCCQSFLPIAALSPGRSGYGYWCVQGPAAKFLNPVDLFPPGH